MDATQLADKDSCIHRLNSKVSTFNHREPLDLGPPSADAAFKAISVNYSALHHVSELSPAPRSSYPTPEHRGVAPRTQSVSAA